MNDRALEFATHAPQRLKALAQVPLQDIDAACREASRAKAAGHVGVQIGNHMGAKNLDDAGLIDFLAHCGREGIPVLVHPWDMMGGDRMKQWMLPWLVAMPAETQLGILSLILSGGFERLPRTLKLCDERALRLLVEVMGEDRVMLGSDYPFPLGEQRVGALVNGAAALGEATKRKIRGANAAAFFGLGQTARAAA
jgi:aminocarboxymuconate-semialdehyde decarboxylase